MSPRSAISFQNVTKRFAFLAAQSRTVLETVLAAFSGPDHSRDRELWAARDVSFDVLPGQSLGIIGRNGSGKSTILKLAAGIIRPTSGRIMVRGRLSALLELGAGFHPDLTGRENIFLNGSILGLDKEAIEACYDSIVEFSGLGDFINMPVKHYSSGMYMRLGFSVAVHVEPDILIIDEILAVGDQSFQNKCIDRIFELKRKGTTIIIVSHNLEMVRTLCSHLIWIENGRMKAVGPADEVIEKYMDSQEGNYEVGADGKTIFQRWGSRQIELTQVRLLNGDGREEDVFIVGDPMTVEMHYRSETGIEEPEFGLAIFRQDGIYISGPDNRRGGLPLERVEGSGVVRFHVDHLPLTPARYRMTAAIYDAQGVIPYDHHEKAYPFRVVAGEMRKTKGLVELPSHWEWVKLKDPVLN